MVVAPALSSSKTLLEGGLGHLGAWQDRCLTRREAKSLHVPTVPWTRPICANPFTLSFLAQPLNNLPCTPF